MCIHVISSFWHGLYIQKFRVQGHGTHPLYVLLNKFVEERIYTSHWDTSVMSIWNNSRPFGWPDLAGYQSNISKIILLQHLLILITVIIPCHLQNGLSPLVLIKFAEYSCGCVKLKCHNARSNGSMLLVIAFGLNCIVTDVFTKFGEDWKFYTTAQLVV